MPCDVVMSFEAFYADDATKWKEILRLIYSYCIDTIEEIATKRNLNDKCKLKASINLLVLAAKCTKQVL